MFYWIYDMQTWTMVIMVCASFLGVTWFGTIFIRPFLRAFLRRQPALNDIVGYLLGAHGVYFGILLGLLALASYQNFSDIEKVVVDEATKLAGLYRHAAAYPPPLGAELTGLLRKYTRFVIDEAWPLQKKGIIPAGGTVMVNDFQDRMIRFEPKTKGQEILHAETYRQFNAFVEARRLRLHSVTTGIPALLWWVVFIGAGVNILLIWMLDVKLVPHLVLSGVISFYLATLIALIAAMDNPFLGEVCVQPDAFESVYESVMKHEPTEAPTSRPGAP
jgi:Protein of unknown function (DUF4239)